MRITATVPGCQRSVRRLFLAAASICSVVSLGQSLGYQNSAAQGSRWEVVAVEGSRATLESDGSPPTMRVLIDATPKGEAGHIRLQLDGISVAGNVDGTVRFRGRAQVRRPIHVGLSQSISPWKSLGLMQEVVLGADWFSYELPFTTTGASPQGRLHFDLGALPPSVEIADVVLTLGGKEVPLAAPRPTSPSPGAKNAAANSGPKPSTSGSDSAGAAKTNATGPVVATSAARPRNEPTTAEPPRPAWSVAGHDGAQATGTVLAKSGDDPERLRINIVNAGKLAWHVQVSIPLPAIKAGEPCEAKVRLRATAKRPFSMTVSQNRPKWNLIGPYQAQTATPEWQDYTLKFVPKDAETVARVQIDLGGDAGAIEISEVTWKAGETSTNVLVLAPPPAKSEIQPKAPPVWTLQLAGGGAAALQPVAGGSSEVMVRIDKPGSQPWDVQVNHTGLAFQKDDACELNLRLRATKARPVSVAVAHAGPTWSNLGLYSRIELGTEWKPIKLEFTAKENSSQARVHIDLGGVDGNVEIGPGSIKIGNRVIPIGMAAPKDASSQPAASNAPPANPPQPNPPKPNQPQGNPREPSQTSANSGASAADWEFLSGGAQASLALVSRQPWHVRADIAGSSEGGNHPTIQRRLIGSSKAIRLRGSSGAKIEVRLRKGDAQINQRPVELTTEWQRVDFPNSSDGDRVVVDLGTAGGSVEVADSP